MTQKSTEIKSKNWHILAYFKVFKPILLSHHPNCDRFKNHIIKIGNLKFCIGCFIGYPSAIISIFIIFFLKSIIQIESIFFLWIGIIFLSFFVLSPFNLTKIKFIKIIQKALIGIGAAFLFWWIWTLPNSFFDNFMLYLIIFGIILTILNLYHAYGFFRVCKKCNYSLNWKNCPGFKNYFDMIEN